ncbi:uncharacterized protein LY79DRAFT_287749 [Colletotrichum navitas]|uniref:Uncharacterized protein n=1 Tax=Colletotrichum navitas TaxID=681940 RepID=A0AAD8VBE7_9PEZI|nr:uncharacterized protein LY79DRAFT_287749 [Colletotrichum navitas]KAK1598400.1 hypothetical protein LY79DRAFT_287749 [Colletotrichum navitas]
MLRGRRGNPVLKDGTGMASWRKASALIIPRERGEGGEREKQTAPAAAVMCVPVCVCGCMSAFAQNGHAKKGSTASHTPPPIPLPPLLNLDVHGTAPHSRPQGGREKEPVGAVLPSTPRIDTKPASTPFRGREPGTTWERGEGRGGEGGPSLPPAVLFGSAEFVAASMPPPPPAYQ